MSKEYWDQFECTNCHKKFRVLQQDADDVIQCPFCKIRPWGFYVSGTEKKGSTVQTVLGVFTQCNHITRKLVTKNERNSRNAVGTADSSRAEMKKRRRSRRARRFETPKAK